MTTQHEERDAGPERSPMQETGQSTTSNTNSPRSAAAESSPPSDPHLDADADGDYKVCRICGDKALGYNFNVISCESCKAFFRRNANKSKEFRCPSNNNCAITVASRRFCQRCRLKKCFDEGMKKEWIMSEDALLERRQRNEGKKFESLRVPVISDTGLIRRAHSYDAYAAEATPAKRTYYGQRLLDDASFFYPNSFVPDFAGRNADFPPPPQPAWNAGLVTPISSYVPVPAMGASRVMEPTSYDPLVVSSRSSFGVPVPIAAGSAQNFSPASPYRAPLLPTQPYHHALADQYQQQQLQRGVHLPSTAISIEPPPQRLPIDAQLTLPRQEAGRLQNEEDYIYVPKAVLANLVSQCYSTMRQAPSAAGSDPNEAPGDHSSTCPPVLAHIRELTSRDKTDPGHRRAPLNCICQCVCGAKSVGSKIGIDKSDKCFGTDPKLDHSLAPQQPEPTRSESQDHARVCGKAGAGNSAIWLSLDEQDLSVWSGSSMNADQPSNAVPDMSLFMWLRMEELIAANRVMDEPADFAFFTKDNGAVVDDGQNAVDVTMMTNICIRRIIRMCKRIGAFKALCQEDQIALLKGGCTEILVLRGVMAYNAKRDTYDVSWHRGSHAQVKLDVLKGVNGNRYDEHKRYLQSFEDTWRRDERIMLMLGALALFYPHRPNIVHEKVICREHDFYLKLLKTYLHITYSQDEAQCYYVALCDRLQTLHQCVHEYAATIFLDVNPRNLEPLLLEVLDLKDCVTKGE